MDGWHLEKALNAWRGGSGNWGYTQYHTAVPLADGAVAYFQYDYAVPYANPALRGKLPDFQTIFLAAAALACLGSVVWLTHGVTKRLRADAQLLAEAGGAIAAGTLESWPKGRPRVREFAAALATMDSLRQELAASLNSQWHAEALRRQAACRPGARFENAPHRHQRQRRAFVRGRPCLPRSRRWRRALCATPGAHSSM